MSTHSHPAVTRSECVLCGPGRPCGHRIPPVYANYPFMSPAAIAATQPEAPEATPETVARRRAAQDRMRRPEQHSPGPREDRSA